MGIHRLQQRLKKFETDNQTNTFPIQAVFWIDAGFGTHENVAWPIEMAMSSTPNPTSIGSRSD
jgi:hypothetical protein